MSSHHLFRCTEALRLSFRAPVMHSATAIGLLLAAISPALAEAAPEVASASLGSEMSVSPAIPDAPEISGSAADLIDGLDAIELTQELAQETDAPDDSDNTDDADDTSNADDKSEAENSIEDDDNTIRLSVEGILEQPVFAPFRQDRPLRDSSRPVYVVPREQIEAQGATTVEEAIRYLPGVLADGTTGGQLGSQSSQFIRGGDTSQTLVLLDGRPINDLGFSGGFDLAEFTTDFVERVEVFPGGSSALYGSSGVGGTINIVTQEPTEEPEFSLRAGYGSFGYNQQVIRTRGSAGDIGWVFGYNRTYAENDFPFELESIDVDNTRDNTEANYNNLNLKLTADIGDRNRLSFSGLYLSRDIGVPGGVPTGEGSLGQFNRLSPNASQYTEDILLDLRWDSRLDEDGDSTLTARVFTDFLDYTFRDPAFSRDEIDRTAVGFQVQHSAKLAEAHRLIYGVDFRTVHAENTTTSFFDGSTSENYEDNVNQGALFALYNFDITDDLSVNLGLRQEFNSLENGSFTSPSAGILWQVSDSTALRANYARSFNAPLFSELEGLAAFDVAGNPDLKPERGNSFDVGIDQKLGDFGLLRLTLFLNRISETVAFEFGSPSTFVNLGETETIGAEIGLDVELTKNLFAFANLTLNDTEILEDSVTANEGNQLSFRDANSVNFGLAYAEPNGLYAGILLHFIGEFFVDNANTEKLGDYATVDLKLQLPIGDNFVLNASLNNLFDESYEVFPGFPGLSRNARASVRWMF